MSIKGYRVFLELKVLGVFSSDLRLNSFESCFKILKPSSIVVQNHLNVGIIPGLEKKIKQERLFSWQKETCYKWRTWSNDFGLWCENWPIGPLHMLLLQN